MKNASISTYYLFSLSFVCRLFMYLYTVLLNLYQLFIIKIFDTISCLFQMCFFRQFSLFLILYMMVFTTLRLCIFIQINLPISCLWCCVCSHYQKEFNFMFLLKFFHLSNYFVQKNNLLGKLILKIQVSFKVRVRVRRGRS